MRRASICADSRRRHACADKFSDVFARPLERHCGICDSRCGLLCPADVAGRFTGQARSRPASPAAPQAPGAKESTRAPVQPVPAESRTPEEAAKRAADPKDPSGALIVEPPEAKP